MLKAIVNFIQIHNFKNYQRKIFSKLIINLTMFISRINFETEIDKIKSADNPIK
ncbi:hypothetical protein [[Mycoplasma] phocae]|uniref:hypothetical protein n=1 Tax=[Mycoplasma] phocae TaxID=142651 RepID=UPI001475654F|nr:hypothetical protein [[Mycoplasma] phocae]